MYFHDDDGQLQLLPAKWTDVVPEDPFVVMAGGRTAFRVRDLLKLGEMVEEALGRAEGECKVNDAANVK